MDLDAMYEEFAQATKDGNEALALEKFWKKIAAYTNETNRELEERNELMPLHLFTAQCNYNYLLEDVIATVDKLDSKRAVI